MSKLTQFMAFFVFLGVTAMLSLGLLFVVTGFSYGMTDGGSFAWLTKGHLYPQSETAYRGIRPKSGLDQYALRDLNFYRTNSNESYVGGDYLGFGTDYSVNLAKGYQEPLK